MPAQDPTTVKLLTLLNVSSLKSKRRSLKSSDSSHEGQSESETPKRRKLGGKLAKVETPQGEEQEEASESEEESDVESQADESPVSTNNWHDLHFGSPQAPDPSILTPASRSAVDARNFNTQLLSLGTEPDHLGAVILSCLEGVESEKPPNDLPSLISEYRDVMLPYVDTSPDKHDNVRRQVCDHIVRHVQKHRKQIIANNVRLLAHSKSAAAALETAKSDATGSSKPIIPDPPSDVRDQGFTRPTVLILLPFRNSALALVDTLISALEGYHNTKSKTTTPPKTENYSRLQNEYGLPPGADDKLLSAEPGTYPSDHVRNFAGNTDDAFRLGIRLSNKGKGWRLFSGFLNSDIIIASPLGLRMGIEREGPPDFLSSLEVMMIDQLDCLTMQNWNHLIHIIGLCNVLPKEANGADFARIREYCLDGHSGYLRQTILLSAYETPQMRALFNNTQLLKNVAGRVRQTRSYEATPIPEGMAIDWVRLDCADSTKEPDARFEYFKQKMVPDILSSAKAQTLIFVPSYFDYLRVFNHLVSHASTSVTGISEYSSNQDISRARQAFFAGTRSILVITERFHFFRRYKLRAVKHITFYGPPDHAQFFTEILSFPFLDDETAPAPADVKVSCLYSKFDYMRLERLEGTKEATAMCASPAVQP
ncbi:digestive organ expansion factor, putative [Rhizoctonia solani AG-3 Rhs1AP]|uniref:U3 small nucleolar RNA-associated protein 25 n=1 Tax=Rhizoctonia solani AG-3 Rhs1AP TaxID=1086054 RepID=A0A0A1UJ02_9AGAM|nr:digestive organ expansion factor, putative [Rhizoctonia solani AG-3 Rhs1AP]